MLALAVEGAFGYSSSAQDRWTDSRGSRGGGRDYGSAGVGDSPSRRAKDNPLLNQALDAFKQASHLEKSLKRSERAVSEQTKELRAELSKAKATAKRTGQVHRRLSDVVSSTEDDDALENKPLFMSRT